MQRTLRSMFKLCDANSVAFAANNLRRSGSLINIVILQASSSTFPDSNNRPLSPSTMSSGVPPTREPMTQQPHAIASRMELENASDDEQETKISIARRKGAT